MDDSTTRALPSNGRPLCPEAADASVRSRYRDGQPPASGRGVLGFFGADRLGRDDRRALSGMGAVGGGFIGLAAGVLLFPIVSAMLDAPSVAAAAVGLALLGAVTFAHAARTQRRPAAVAGAGLAVTVPLVLAIVFVFAIELALGAIATWPPTIDGVALLIAGTAVGAGAGYVALPAVGGRLR